MTITDFSALTLRLPLLDRATLSQAWRDALHETVQRPLRASGGVAASATRQTSAARELTPRDIIHGLPKGSRRIAARAFVRVSPAECGGPKRSASLPRTSIPPQPSNAAVSARETCVMTLPNGERICFLVNAVATHVHVTILCAPHLQSDMRRALAVLAQSLVHSSIALKVSSLARAA